MQTVAAGSDWLRAGGGNGDVAFRWRSRTCWRGAAGVDPALLLQLRTVLTGLDTGILTTLLFTLPSTDWIFAPSGRS